MNITQFWIVDTIVKHNAYHTPIYLDEAMDEDLLVPIYDEENDNDDNANDDDDDDDMFGDHHYTYTDDSNHWSPFIPSPLNDGEQDAVSLSSSLKPLTGHQDSDPYFKTEQSTNPWTDSGSLTAATAADAAASTENNFTEDHTSLPPSSHPR
jgi:hypothetical protein